MIIFQLISRIELQTFFLVLILLIYQIKNTLIKIQVLFYQSIILQLKHT